MCALGHKRTFAVQRLMSALPRKRTCAVQLGMSAMGQKRTCPSFDELVGTREQLRGHDETDSLRSF
jgi:hypothetical protein